MGPYLLIKFNWLKSAEPLQAEGLLLATNSPGVLVLAWSTLEEWKFDSTWSYSMFFLLARNQCQDYYLHSPL